VAYATETADGSLKTATTLAACPAGMLREGRLSQSCRRSSRWLPTFGATTLATGPTLIKRGQAGVLRESRLG